MAQGLTAVKNFLLCATPEAWLSEAIRQQSLLLIDHANCEKKAAGTALGMMYRYIDQDQLLQKLSRLAREELRHFEQVHELMRGAGVPYVHVSPSRYAAELRKPIRTYEPERLVDSLIVGAVVEARSCERFACLSGLLENEIGRFYSRLLASEARHYADYLSLAEAASTNSIVDRVQIFLELDKSLIQSPDRDFRFHSGVPAA